MARQYNYHTHWIKTPEGKDVKFVGLRRFCKENGLNPSALLKVINGERKTHKGYRQSEVQED